MFWLYGGWSLYQLYSSQNAAAMDNSVVWNDALLGLAHLLVAFLYLTNFWNCRRLFPGPALLALVAGVYFLSGGLNGVHWSMRGILHGELVEMGALSSIGYLFLGVIGLTTLLCRQHPAAQGNS